MCPTFHTVSIPTISTLSHSFFKPLFIVNVYSLNHLILTVTRFKPGMKHRRLVLFPFHKQSVYR